MLNFPEGFFDRADETPDADFYCVPRLVAHVDEVTIDALRGFYADTLIPIAGSEGLSLLDLMSSWISHLPESLALRDATGLGMNEAELAENPRLHQTIVRDLNEQPQLPFPDARFDVVLNAFSIQYLTQPIDVFRDIARVLAPGGLSIVAMSHRCFPTKAIRAFHHLDGEGRCNLVAAYHHATNAFDDIQCLDRSPSRGDPLWLVVAKKSAATS